MNVVRKEIEDFYRALQYSDGENLRKVLQSVIFESWGFFGKQVLLQKNQGILSSVVCRPVDFWSVGGVVCRNPMSILRGQWSMLEFLPFAPLFNSSLRRKKKQKGNFLHFFLRIPFKTLQNKIHSVKGLLTPKWHHFSNIFLKRGLYQPFVISGKNTFTFERSNLINHG